MSMHGFSEQQWLEFLEGALPADQTARLTAHVGQCEECSRTASELRTWQAAISAEAGRLCQGFHRSEAEISALLDRFFDRLYRGGPAIPIEKRLLLLDVLLTPLCGPEAVRRLVRAAGSACRAADLQDSDWPLFITHLSALAASVCGTAAGRLIHQAGARLGGRL